MCLLYFGQLSLGLAASAEDKSKWLPKRSVCFVEKVIMNFGDTFISLRVICNVPFIFRLAVLKISGFS